MDVQLHTAAEAAGILNVRESWLKTKAAARLIPCTFIGKHLRFSDDDTAEIMRAGARQPVTSRQPRPAVIPPERQHGLRTAHGLTAHTKPRATHRDEGGDGT
jgi:hypothetical protein